MKRGGEGGIQLPPLPATSSITYTYVILASIYAGCKRFRIVHSRLLPFTLFRSIFAKSGITGITQSELSPILSWSSPRYSAQRKM